MPKANKKISPNISCRHRRSAPSYQLSIVFRGDVILSRHHDGHTRLVHFSWHMCDAAVDARRRRRKAGEAVSTVLDRHACEQHGLLWASRRSILTGTFRVSSELNDGHRWLLHQDPILAHGQSNLWHDRHAVSQSL